MKLNLLKSLMLLFVFLGIASYISAQEVYQIEAGTDGISTALLDVQNGDIIELTTSGGEYIETGSDSIDVDVTIRAAAFLEEKPVIKGGGGVDNVFNVRAGGLNLEGVVLEGGAYIVSVKAPATVAGTDFSLRINYCDFRNWEQRAVYISDGTLVPLDSVLIKDCTFIGGVKQAIYLKTTRTGSGIFPGAYKYCKVENCLMSGLTSDSDGHATYIEPGNRDIPGDGWPTVIIDHVTVNNCPRGLSTYTTPGALVQNVIISNPTVLDRTSIDIQSGRWTTEPLPLPSTVKNSVYVGALNLQGSSTVIGVTENCDSAAVVYEDLENGEFRLADGSPGKGGATDGTDVGYIVPIKPNKVKSIKAGTSVKVFPNPTSGQVQITLSADLASARSIEIFDLTGKLVTRVNDLNGKTSVRVDLTSSPAGMYIGKIISDTGAATFKLLKR